MSLNTFEHGIHPSYNKELTAGKGIEKAALPVKVAIPLQQHIGAPCKPLVKKGDAVTEGQKLGEATTFIPFPVCPVAFNDNRQDLAAARIGEPLYIFYLA